MKGLSRSEWTLLACAVFGAALLAVVLALSSGLCDGICGACGSTGGALYGGVE